jgi:hypothetical protein
MASIIPQSSLQGGLFELVARGRKDTYFVTDRETSVLPFNSRYEPSTAYLKERRTTVPLNAPQFGNTFEVELDKYGDVLLECNLLVDLPTWLPPLPVANPTVATGNQVAPPYQANSQYWIKDASGNSYGYTKLIGYFLFERIQLYQDSYLLQEWSGDGLFATRASEGSWNSGYLDYQFLGGNDVQSAPPARSVALRATPGRLRLSLPLPGLQGPADGGLPLCALPAQSFRLRIKLRTLEDLVESDAPGATKPVPWDPALTYSYTPAGGVPYSFKPLDRAAIGQPTILLETVQAYVDADTQHALQNNRKAIPFRRMFENIFTMGELDYKPLDSGGVAQVTRRLDGRHPTERIVWFFRNFNALCANKYTDLVNGRALDGQFYSQMKLVIAGRDRELEWGPEIWQDVENYAKDEIDTGYNIGEMRWGLGDQYELQRPYTRVPDGTVNFTTADRPTLHINLNNIFPEVATAQRKAEMRVMTEGWAIYEIAEGRGRLMFAN